MADQAKNILIGIFVIAACVIIIFILLFLHPSVGDEGQVLRVRFADIDKITLGTRVTYGGKPVGEVIEIREIQEPPGKEREGFEGYVYLYELLLRVDSHVKVYNTDEISSRTSGLLGEKSVEINPLPLKPGQKLELVNNKILYANESGSVEETLKELKTIGDRFAATLDSVKIAVDQFNQMHVMTKIDATVQHLNNITGALDNSRQLSEILTNIHRVSKRVNKSWDKVDEALNKVDLSINKFDSAIDDIRVVTTNVGKGQGTFGRLFMKEDLYLQLSSILSKGETLFDDINHYGLFFQNDKRWQRLRARRANLLYQLSCPEQFRNYFNDELNQITSSLSRISMLLEDTSCCDCYEDFMDNEDFRAVFAELMRRVKEMEDSLKIYNQQLVDKDLRRTELICY